MNWDAVGAVAELVGALAVIVTVAYLAVQIRQNTAGSVREAVTETSRLIASDPSVARIFWAGLEDRSALTELDRHRFDALLALTFFGQREAFETSAHRREVFGFRFILGHPGVRDWWGIYSTTFPDKFREYVEGILNEQTPNF